MSFSMKLQRKVGTTSQIIEIFVENSASAGNGKSGLTNATSSLTAYYKRNKDNASVAITLATCTLGTFSSGGFKEVDATNMVGVYELHIPNTALAAGADNVLICLQGASGMFPVIIQIELTAVDNQNAVNGGITALPTTVCADPSGSLITKATADGSGQSVTQADLDHIVNAISAQV